MLANLNNYGREGLKTPVRGSEVGPLIGDSDLYSLLPATDAPAIIEASTIHREITTHLELHHFVCNAFDLRQFGIGYGRRVALILPNSPELAVCIISVISKWCAAPINSTNTYDEIRGELISTKSTVIVVLENSNNEAAIKAAQSLSLGIILLTESVRKTGLFTLKLHTSPAVEVKETLYSYPRVMAGFTSYHHNEIVLLLHTSGTSGNKKCVPYTLDMILVGVGCIIASWNLKSNDVCLNMMPLFHIGGIVRNLLSPILSGGAMISCRGFDAAQFWDVLGTYKFTWYYAAPTMHHAILQEAEHRPKPLSVQSVRFIANAAGGLLPVLADRLKTTFDAVILTSYGMTECMPISSPTQSYRMNPIGTSGQAVGPDILISDEDHSRQLPTGQVGNILVRGPPCFAGYENNEASNAESFYTINGEQGWFDTGDTGCVDAAGFLFVSGRSKEIINKGGETISPFEIEEAVLQHPKVQECMAFSVPHDRYQETVGIWIVPPKGGPRGVDLPSLHAYLETCLHRSKWPQVIVFSTALPKNAAGKILRIKMAERTRMPAIDEESPVTARLYEADCPRIGAPLTQQIEISPISPNLIAAEDVILKFPGASTGFY